MRAAPQDSARIPNQGACPGNFQFSAILGIFGSFRNFRQFSEFPPKRVRPRARATRSRSRATGPPAPGLRSRARASTPLEFQAPFQAKTGAGMSQARMLMEARQPAVTVSLIWSLPCQFPYNPHPNPGNERAAAASCSRTAPPPNAAASARTGAGDSEPGFRPGPAWSGRAGQVTKN